MALNSVPTSDRMTLAALPTPLINGLRLATALGLEGRLLVKRDDLTGFAVAGNKARPLEFLAAEARSIGADVLVTGGTEASNFCQATAATAAVLGTACELVYAGSATGSLHTNARAAHAWGASLRWTGNSDRASVDTAIEKVAAEVSAKGRTPYVLPRGGATPRGSLGYYFAARELAAQLDGPALIVIAVGSGGTLAGLLAGAAALELPWRFVGASVSRPPDVTAERVLSLARRCADLMSTRRPDAIDVHIHDARGPGHGRPSNEGEQATRVALQADGLILDPAYTAKALGALPTICRSHQDVAATVVFWHTGGLLEAVHEWET